MSLTHRVDTYKIEFGEYGAVEVETEYYSDRDNIFSIRSKPNEEDAYFSGSASMSAGLIFALINTLKEAMNALDKLNDIDT